MNDSRHLGPKRSLQCVSEIKINSLVPVMKARNDRIYTFHSTHSAPSVQRAHNNAWVSNENVIRKRYSRLFIVSLYFSCSIMHFIRAIIAHAIHALKHSISSHLIANNFQATISQMPW